MIQGYELRKSLVRDQICLNGEWNDQQQVPHYEGINYFDQADFSRSVTIPVNWSGKIIKLEFDSVNFIAEVYINNCFVKRHVGGWIPFSVDLTGHAIAGDTFELRMHVKGSLHQPIADEEGRVQWPVGGWRRKGNSSKGGIADDVWLRAYGKVHILDTYIQTSYRQQNVTIDYTVTNSDNIGHTFSIESNAALSEKYGEQSGETFFISGPTITLESKETQIVRVVKRWLNPHLWFPDNPKLYFMNSSLICKGQIIDQESRRFGFREFWIKGNQFQLNDIRINMYGDYQVFGDRWYVNSPELHSPDVWVSTVDQMLSQNIRILRWHQNPVPQYLLDIADEKGLLICSEAANYGRDFHDGCNHKQYIGNSITWIQGWIKANRHHPSIYLWNASNEMTYQGIGDFNPKDLRMLGDAIRLMDTTRPVNYDGDDQVEDEMIDYHYPEGYNFEPCGRIKVSGPSNIFYGDESSFAFPVEQHHGSIYSWGHLVHQHKPTGSGECLHTRSPLAEVQYAVERNTWWLGIWLRGMRYTNWTNVKPSCFWFARNAFESQRATNMRNAYAPVALFDKAYDDLGIIPYVTGLTPGGTLPVWKAGSKPYRTLILYNDEFSGTTIDVDVELLVGSTLVAKGTRTFHVPLGEHIDIPYSFQIPITKEDEALLILRTYKDSVLKFEEIRRFLIQNVMDHAYTVTSDQILIGEVWK